MFSALQKNGHQWCLSYDKWCRKVAVRCDAPPGGHQPVLRMNLAEFWEEHKEEMNDIFDRKRMIDPRINEAGVGIFCRFNYWNKYGNALLFFVLQERTIGYVNLKTGSLYVKQEIGAAETAKYMVKLWNGTLDVLEKKYPYCWDQYRKENHQYTIKP